VAEQGSRFATCSAVMSHLLGACQVTRHPQVPVTSQFDTVGGTIEVGLLIDQSRVSMTDHLGQDRSDTLALDRAVIKSGNWGTTAAGPVSAVTISVAAMMTAPGLTPAYRWTIAPVPDEQIGARPTASESRVRCGVIAVGPSVSRLWYTVSFPSLSPRVTNTGDTWLSYRRLCHSGC
jgi:hypothetical protein